MLKEHDTFEADMVHVDRMSLATQFLATSAVDIVLLDLGLPDVQGLDAVRRVHAAAPHTPLVVLTGRDDESLAIQSMQEGAQDYLVKGHIETRELPKALRYAMERKLMDEALFTEMERAKVTLNSIGDGVACTNTAGDITYLNLVAERMTGWSQGDGIGRPWADVLRIVDAGSREAIPDPMERAIGKDRVGHLPPNCVLIRRDNSEIPVEDSVAPIHDRTGGVAGAVIVLRDVSAAREMALQILHSAEHDFLTGLPNRLLLSDRVGQAIAAAARRGTKIVVLFLDLDGFKHINDSLGHSCGDLLLQSTAKRLVDCVRDSDTVSRQGGDEFVVLLTDVEKWEDVTITVSRILKALAEPHAIGPHDLHITASIGVSLYPDDGMNAEVLIKNADTAMYQAKDNGRHTYQFFTQPMYERAVERQSIEEGLRRALEREELIVYYQPQIDLVTGAIAGAEALIRWIHPTRGFVPPNEFIPVAEDCGLIVPIGKWVLREACRQTRAWRDGGLRLDKIAVNVSAIEFRAHKFLEGVFEVLKETDLDPGSLEIEVTESALMKRADAATSTLESLHARGVQVAIDDFGTGYSSLSYLRKFRIDALKIDQSFVRQIGADIEDTAIVTAVIAMAKSLKLRVIAEGVETKEELDFLRRNECDEVQGYYFSRPVPPGQFEALLRAGIPSVTPAPVRDRVETRATSRVD